MRAWCCSAKSPAEIPALRLQRSIERRLDAAPDAEEVVVLAVVADDHQSDGRTDRRDRHGNCAAVEKIDNRRVAQQ